MRLLLEDGFSVEKGTGVGRYTQNLARELRKCSGVEVLPLPDKGPIGKLPSTIRRIAYAFWLETAFQNTVEKLRADLVHFTNYLVPRRRRPNVKYAVSIHDLTPWRLPEALPSVYRGYIRMAVSRAVRVADLILCPSHSVRKEVIEHFGLDEKRVRTAWNGQSQLPEIPPEDRDELCQRLFSRIGIQKQFLLFVGTLERRKNIVTLIKAFARVAKASELQLVLAGRPGFGFSEIEAAIRQQPWPERYILAGYVTDDELAVLYSQAALFVYPSLYEGFGIPLIEAMGIGLPIVASRIPASEEVAGDAALYYDNPLDATALADRIDEVFSNSAIRAELTLRGKQRAERFRWENVVGMYIDAYKSSLASR
jgi:glycosyltransferase involved in cell wall biosynthesis